MSWTSTSSACGVLGRASARRARSSPPFNRPARRGRPLPPGYRTCHGPHTAATHRAPTEQISARNPAPSRRTGGNDAGRYTMAGIPLSVERRSVTHSSRLRSADSPLPPRRRATMERPADRPAAAADVEAASPSVDAAAPSKPRYRIGKKKPTVPAAPPPAPTEHPTPVDAPPPPHALPPPPPPEPGRQPSRARQGNCSLPFGWLEAPRGGGPGCSLHGLVPVKCPLSERFGLGPAERWTPSDAVEACGGAALVGLVIDLTNTSRYYRLGLGRAG